MRAIVIGAGAIGLMSALRLAERGAEVTVLEYEREGAKPTRTASRAAAGMLGPLSETMTEQEGVHKLLLELGLESLDLWRDRGAQLELSTFPARGARLIGYPEDQTSALATFAKALGRRAEERGDALVLPDEAALDPAAALAAIERALTAKGGLVRRGAVVVDADARHVTLADASRREADVVVLATGVWSPAMSPAFAHLVPMKGQIVELDSNAIAPGETMRGPGIYAVGRAQDRVVIGSTMEPHVTDLVADPETIADLAARAGALSRGLQHARIVRAWAGVRPMSPDWAPRIGRSNGMIVACGHSRNGWLLAPVTAEIVAAHAFYDDLRPLWMEFAL